MTKAQKDRLKEEVECFRAGDFDRVKILLAENLKESPDDPHSILYTGFIALLENRLEDAVTGLRHAHQLMPLSLSAKSLLSDAYFRQDDFANAARLYASLNRKAHAAKLDYLSAHPVYEAVSPSGRSELRFVRKDPLPLVQAGINGNSPVNFLVDTGGAELIIDSEYAKSLNLKDFGIERSVFGGGKKGNYSHSCVENLSLGDIHVKNVPAVLLDTRRFSDELYGGECRVDGILGTSVIYHFLTTLDYANDKIVFEVNGRKRSRSTSEPVPREGFAEVPFWMAGDHFMVARGSVNGGPGMLFLIDTGLGGTAFTCPQSTIKACRLVPQKQKAGTGQGGGGNMKIVPFDVETLELDGVTGRNLHGSFGPFPETLEYAYEFRIGGLVSHEFFRTRTVVFDFSSMILYVK